MKTRWIWLAAAGMTLVAACKGTKDNTGIVARVDGHALTVDQAVKLLEDQENIPNQADVVKAIANLWVDYTLLADDVAKDTTLEDIHLEPLVRQQLEQQMVYQLRDSVIKVDTAVSESELKALYEKEAPGARLTVSHILLNFPAKATGAQRDSVRALAESLRKRAAAGESFASLARRYSEDQATASKGGKLGTFGRGDMLPALDSAAFSLEPGQVSGVLESPYGLHILRVDDKTVPGFEEMQDSFRIKVQNQRYAVAESLYVAGLEQKADPKIADNAESVVKEVAKDPSVSLSRRAAARPLVSFQGGAVTVGEFQLMMQARPDQAQFSQGVQQATDEQIDNFLRGMARRDLLVAEAKKKGFEPSQARVDSLVDNLRGQLLGVAGEIGLRRLDRAPGEALEPAVDRAVLQSLQDILTGAKNVVPLGQVSFQLRSSASPAIYDPGVSQVMLQIAKVRASRGPAPIDTLGQGAKGATGATGTSDSAKPNGG